MDRSLAAFAIAAAAFAAGRLMWRTPEPPLWSGIRLGGSEIALNPRLSPDGHLLAFEAMVDGLTQVAVMKPESGNWSVLTRDRRHGPAVDISWSPDGTLIYYDRVTDVPKGIFSVPVLGGDEHLVVEDAGLPEALPDGTLLIKKLNARREAQLHRFWPGTGRLQALPLRMSPTSLLAPRAAPDGKTALVLGEPIGKAASARAWYRIDLSSGDMKPLSPSGLKRAGDATDAYVVAVSRDGKSVIAAQRSGVLTRITSFSTSGAVVERSLLTVTSTVQSLDTGPDGSLYTSISDRLVDVVRSLPDGTRSERLASFPQGDGATAGLLTVLPDGRAVLPVRASGRIRLMAVQMGKDPTPLVNTTEEAAAPFCTCGSREVAFMVGPPPHETIAFTEPASGRLVRRIAPAKGPVDSLSCSPDGKTLYFAALGVIWRIPSAGGEAQTIRSGDSVVADPSGSRLIVQVVESSHVRQFSVPLGGAPEHEIPLDHSLPVRHWPLSPSSLNADGRLLATLSPPDSWFDPPGIIDTATGRITRIPSEDQSDNHSMGWTPEGKVIIVKTGLRATLWKFQPVLH